MKRKISPLLVQLLLIHGSTNAFHVPSHLSMRPTLQQMSKTRQGFVAGNTESEGIGTFDPLGFASDNHHHLMERAAATQPESQSQLTWLGPASAALVVLGGGASSSMADEAVVATAATMTPQTFQPVCPASDGFYRVLQGTVEGVVGKAAFVEYGPLIAGGLLRVRLELCVVESFFNEAVGPFIKENGLSWVLPFHETVETFLAGTVFALATTFILVGSTKLLTVIVTYVDVFLGLPLRTVGGFAFDRARGKPITLDVGVGPFKTRVVGPPKKEGEDEEPEKLFDFDSPDGDLTTSVIFGGFKTIGEASRLVREAVDSFDLFVGRYLVFLSTSYILFKFLHFKVFPDFP